jgi:hypothetical protein
VHEIDEQVVASTISDAIGLGVDGEELQACQVTLQSIRRKKSELLLRIERAIKFDEKEAIIRSLIDEGNELALGGEVFERALQRVSALQAQRLELITRLDGAVASRRFVELDEALRAAVGAKLEDEAVQRCEIAIAEVNAEEAIAYCEANTIGRTERLEAAIRALCRLELRSDVQIGILEQCKGLLSEISAIHATVLEDVEQAVHAKNMSLLESTLARADSFGLSSMMPIRQARRALQQMQVEHATAYAKDALAAMSRAEANRVYLVETAIGKLEAVGIMQGSLHADCVRKLSELRTKVIGLHEVVDRALKSADEVGLEEILAMAQELNLPEFPRLEECTALLRQMREQSAVQRFEEALESRSINREKLLEKSASIVRELNLDTDLARRVLASLESLLVHKQEIIRTMFAAVRDKQKEQLAQAVKRARDLGIEIPRGTRQKLADEGMSRGMSIQQLLGI